MADSRLLGHCEAGLSGNSLRCLKPGQNFRKFNSDHFPFFKNLNPTSGSKVSVAGRSGRSGNGLRCLEPCQKFRKTILIIFLFLKISIGRLVPELVFLWLEIGSGRSGNGLEMVCGVWNQARNSENSILIIFLF